MLWLLATIKFPLSPISIDELIAAIKDDIRIAQEALENEEMRALREQFHSHFPS